MVDPRTEITEHKFKSWRKLFYRLAATGFAPPTSALVTDLDDKIFIQGMIKISELFELNLLDRISTLEAYITRKNRPELLEDLQAEYVRLFVTDTGGPLTQPYGSYYLDGRIMGDSVNRVVSEYSKAGFAKDPSYQDLPDHIAAELEFLYHLTQSENDGNLSSQLRFLEENLVPWFPDFCKQVVQSAKIPFYKILAIWTKRGLTKDYNTVRKLLNGVEKLRLFHLEVFRENE